jgi:hypothetical protein
MGIHPRNRRWSSFPQRVISFCIVHFRSRHSAPSVHITDRDFTDLSFPSRWFTETIVDVANFHFRIVCGHNLWASPIVGFSDWSYFNVVWWQRGILWGNKKANHFIKCKRLNRDPNIILMRTEMMIITETYKKWHLPGLRPWTWGWT